MTVRALARWLKKSVIEVVFGSVSVGDFSLGSTVDLSQGETIFELEWARFPGRVGGVGRSLSLPERDR